MKGKNTFTNAEVNSLRDMIRLKCNAGKHTQKAIRAKMRRMKFYIEDFMSSMDSVEDFEQLIIERKIVISDNEFEIKSSGCHSKIESKSECIDVDKTLNKEGLDPIINKSTKTLILGSLPGDESISRYQYYAQPNNRFWKIIFGLYKITVIPQKYENKISFLKEKGIGIWDVLHNADREGSNDSSIDSFTKNDIYSIIEKYPNIHLIAFNGKKAQQLFNSNFDKSKFINVKFKLLPSSSGANCKYKLNTLLDKWSVITK